LSSSVIVLIYAISFSYDTVKAGNSANIKTNLQSVRLENVKERNAKQTGKAKKKDS
jgi:hypothetical protein